MILNPKERELARAAAARMMQPEPKPVVRACHLPEPKQVIKPKYIFKQYNGKYRAIVRIDRVDHRLGVFTTMAYAVQAQKQFCLKMGTTYEAVFNAPYPKRRKGAKV
jgi:hypothetical protein